MSKTLLAAMGFASQIRDDARREADMILRKASSRALERATVVQREHDDLEREVARLRRIADETNKGLSTLLVSTLGQLKLQSETDPRSSEPGTEFQEAMESSLHRATHDGPDSTAPGEEAARSFKQTV